MSDKKTEYRLGNRVFPDFHSAMTAATAGISLDGKVYDFDKGDFVDPPKVVYHIEVPEYPGATSYVDQFGNCNSKDLGEVIRETAPFTIEAYDRDAKVVAKFDMKNPEKGWVPA